MKRTIFLLYLLLLVACRATGSVENPPRTPAHPLSQQAMSEISQAELRGQLLYQKDMTAARATDHLLGQVRAANFPTLKGWIVDSRDQGEVVRFFTETTEGPGVAYDVVFSRNLEPSLRDNPNVAVTDAQLAMYRARQLALQSVGLTCSDSYNTVVLADQESGGWLVYLLAATKKPDEILVGGHYRVHVDRTGTAVVSVHALSRSCLTLEKQAQAAAFMVTHVMSDYPIETHVYLSLLHQKDFFVSTRAGLWKVAQGHITQVSR